MGSSWGFIEPISHQSEYFWRSDHAWSLSLRRASLSGNSSNLPSTTTLVHPPGALGARRPVGQPEGHVGPPRAPGEEAGLLERHGTAVVDASDLAVAVNHCADRGVVETGRLAEQCRLSSDDVIFIG